MIQTEIITSPKFCFLGVMITLNCKSNSQKQQDNTDHTNDIRQLWLYTDMISHALVLNGLVVTIVTTHLSWANVPTSCYPIMLLCMLQSITICWSLTGEISSLFIRWCIKPLFKSGRHQPPTTKTRITITIMLAITLVTSKNYRNA